MVTAGVVVVIPGSCLRCTTGIGLYLPDVGESLLADVGDGNGWITYVAEDWLCNGDVMTVTSWSIRGRYAVKCIGEISCPYPEKFKKENVFR